MTTNATPSGHWPAKYPTLGIDVSGTTYADVVDALVRAVRERRRAIVDFMPVSVLIEAAQDPEFRKKLNDFDVICPDGQPIRWCLNYFHGLGLRNTVSGTVTMERACEAAAKNGIAIYLYGSTRETLAKLQANLLARFPDLRIVGVESPPFVAPTSDGRLAAARRINESGAGFVFIGLGSPKQEHFAWAQRTHIEGVQLCVGAAFDFIAGTKRRAPSWMQRLGLEWLHRLCCEPRRLARRYLVGNSRFAALVAPELWRHRRRTI